MTKFSANLGFLWADLPLPNAIRMAAKSGFDAVECHWPYEYPAAQILEVLDETGLPMMSINTLSGNQAAGEFGLTALPNRNREAENFITQAVDYAHAINTSNVHVMAGVASGPEALDAFVKNLNFATEYALGKNVTILIEAINKYDVPGYFLNSTNQALEILNQVAAPNLKLMFDCYHVHRCDDNVAALLEELYPHIGHIQFAGIPDRGPPHEGDLDFGPIFSLIDSLGYKLPIGAEYKPMGKTNASLEWLEAYTN